jgi:hypothetical protein
LVVSLTSGEAFDVSDIPFFKPTSEDDHGLSSMIAVIAGKVDLKSSTHIPSKARLSEMLGFLAKELLYLPGLGGDLLLAQAHAIPRCSGRVAAVNISVAVWIWSCSAPARLYQVPVHAATSKPAQVF